MDILIFDKQGHLTPYDLIPTNIATIEWVFITSFPVSVMRRSLFEAFMSHLTELKAALNTPLEIWLNGSFVTQKRNSNDVDFVIFVDKQIATLRQDIIYQFRQRRYGKMAMTDGYFVEVAPEGHPAYTLYQLDRQDWHRTFVFGRNGQKGYLQLIF